jgi:glutamine synthetase
MTDIKHDIGSAESLVGSKNRSAKEVVDLIKKENVKLVDAVFTDPLGLWQHCHFTAAQLDEAAFAEGLPFDGSSIKLFKVINESDMIMVPDPNTAWIDPFQSVKTLHILCNITEPDANTAYGYGQDPRSIAIKAGLHLKSTGIADTAFFGPEPEFFIFDSVTYGTGTNYSSYHLEAHEGYWNTNKDQGKNLGHRAEPKGWYFPVAPIDTLSDIRSDMLLTMADIGLPVEKHHHEVAVAQCELGIRALPLLQCADAVQTYKYVVKNVAKKHNKTVTFMAKPILGDNGTGMHVHQSLWKDGKPLFWDSNSKYVNFSDMGMHYIGGLLKHAPALCAFTNPTTNSYKRLVPGYEAPVNLAFSKGNRSAAVRIPMYNPHNPKLKRLEFRCPDATCNPYIAFSAMLLAGLDGIKNKINPGEPLDVDIYELSAEELKKIKTAPGSLSEALDNLEKDHDWLVQGGVFSEEFISSYIKLKRAEAKRVETAPHPLEFAMYYHQ